MVTGAAKAAEEESNKNMAAAEILLSWLWLKRWSENHGDVVEEAKRKSFHGKHFVFCGHTAAEKVKNHSTYANNFLVLVCFMAIFALASAAVWLFVGVDNYRNAIGVVLSLATVAIAFVTKIAYDESEREEPGPYIRLVAGTWNTCRKGYMELGLLYALRDKIGEIPDDKKRQDTRAAIAGFETSHYASYITAACKTAMLELLVGEIEARKEGDVLTAGVQSAAYAELAAEALALVKYKPSESMMRSMAMQLFQLRSQPA